MGCRVQRIPAAFRRRGLLVAALLTAAAAPVAGQARLSTVVRELDWAGEDIIRVWTSPFRMDGGDLPPLLAVTGTGVLLGVFDDEIQRWVDGNQEAGLVKLLGPVREQGILNHVGRTYVLVPLSVLFILGGTAAADDDLRDAGLGCGTANLATTLPRATSARLIGRARPLVEEGPYIFKPFTFNDWNFYSLPGGHVANITACASFWSHRFDLGIGEPLLYAFAVALGVGRIIDRAHWASDTWFGMALGWAIGRLIAERMLERRAALAGASVQQVRVPLYIGWRFAF